MSDNRYGTTHTIYDAEYRSENSLNGQINFRKNKTKLRIKYAFEGIVFIAVAAASGGITADIISTRKNTNTNIIYHQYTQSLSGMESAETKSNVTRVWEQVAPSIVNISSQGSKGSDQDMATGIVIRADGYIVTDYHSIKGDNNVVVRFSNNDNSLKGKVLGADSASDLAVVKVDASNLSAVKLGDSSKSKIGDEAIAIGNPLIGNEFAGTVTAGIISGVNKNFKFKDTNGDAEYNYKAMLTDAMINSGNSGGPLCSDNGEVIGMNIRSFNDDKNSIENMGVAISSNEVRSIVDSIIKKEHKSRITMGIDTRSAVSFGKKVLGAYVCSVNSQVAYNSGIRPTDIITELDNIKVKNGEHLYEIIQNHKSGDLVKGKLLKADGKVTNFTITLWEVDN